MQLAIRGNSPNNFFFQILYNFLEDTLNPLCSNLLISEIIFNYFPKPWWQSTLTAVPPEGFVPRRRISLTCIQKVTTQSWNLILVIQKSRINIWGVVGSAFVILSSPSQISALGFVEYRGLCLLCVCANSSLSRELAAAQDQSQSWCPNNPSYGLSFNANEELLTCIVFQEKERKFRKGSAVLEFEEHR